MTPAQQRSALRNEGGEGDADTITFDTQDDYNKHFGVQ